MSEGKSQEFSINDLKIVDDKPNPESNLFNFDKISEQLTQIITDPNLSTPFVIGIDGEWGSGKTTLLTKTYNSIQKMNNSSWKVIWFNAWKYEKYDPVFALYQSIRSELKDASQKLKDILQNVAEISLDAFTKKTTGMTIKEIAGHFEDSMKVMNTLENELEAAIGKSSRLLIFVDDLDRCDNDKILEILFNIKEVLSAKNTVFILGIDMKKIERAWDIKHKGYDQAVLEGKDHIDKLFQLKIQLPKKNLEQLLEFLDSHVKLDPRSKKLIACGTMNNPRKIKHTLNTIYFASKNIDDIEMKYGGVFAHIVASSILYNCYKDIMEIAKENPYGLYHAAYVCHAAKFFGKFQVGYPDIKQNFQHGGYGKDMNMWNTPLSTDTVTTHCLQILEIAYNDRHSFDFLNSFAEYWNLREGYTEPDDYEHYVELLRVVLTQMPFL